MQLKFSKKDAFNFSGHPCMGASPSAWWNSLKDAGFDFDTAYLPKVLFISGNVLFNAPVQWLEKLRFSNNVQREKIKAPLFILGHPRSGTTLLQYLLSKDPQFNYCTTTQALLPNVYLTMGGILSGILKKALPKTRPMDNLKMGADMPKEEEFALGNLTSKSMIQAYLYPRQMQRFFDENVLFKNEAAKEAWKKYFLYFCKKINHKNSGKTLLLKSPNNTARVREILEIFPDAKFIHIYRNPYKVFLSNERLYEKILPFTSLQKVEGKAVQDFIFYSYKAMMQKYLQDKTLIASENLVEIAYEDFTQDPLPLLKNIYSKFYPNRFSEIKTSFEQEWKAYENYQTNVFELDAAVQKRIEQEWAFAFEAFGYKQK
ncbi:MAG: sulfotransferase [Chitinophagales bacterium]